MKREVYNLEFRRNCQEMTICGYRFTRVADYEGALKSLQHLFSWHSEFKVDRVTGGHAITAYVELPPNEQEAVLAWVSPGEETALSDILLLLSLFTGRDVFWLDNTVNRVTGPVIVADPRVYPFGGVLQTSIPYAKQLANPDDPLSDYDIAFEQHLNQTCELIRTDDWRDRYERGYFLFLAQQVFRSHALDVAFTLCWTIWEHLFAVLNRKWMSDDALRRMYAAEKLAFLFVEYKMKGTITKKNKTQIDKWVRIRNHLVHDRRLPEIDPSKGTASSARDGSVWGDMFSFIQFTESIVARILGLSSTHALTTLEVREFLET